jgi:sRNA-binding carbon storage regulator CsrA
MSHVLCKSGERIRIGGNIEIVVVRSDPNAVELAITLPPGVAMCKQDAEFDGIERALQSYCASRTADESSFLAECN